MKREATRLLAKHEVSRTQYLLWAERRFRRLAFGSGVGFGLAFMAPLLWAAATAHRAGDPQEMWGMVAGATFVGLLFLVGALRVGRTSGASRGFEALDVGRRTSPEYMKGLRPRHWDAARAIDVAAWEARDARRAAGPRRTLSPARREALLETKLRLRRWGLRLSAVLVAAVVATPLYMDLLASTSWPGRLVAWTLGALFVAAAAGMHGWLFMYGYLGVAEARIRLYGEFSSDDSDHEGKAAAVIGAIVMGVAALSFALFMTVPIALLLGLD